MNRSTFKRWFITLAFIIFLVVLQTGAGRVLSVKSVAPDLLFAFILAFSAVEKKWLNVLEVALICGIFSDFVCHSEFMGYTAVYSYTASAAYFLKNMLLKPNVFFVNALAVVMFIAGKLLLFPVLYFTKEVAFTEFFLNDALPSAVYNTVYFFVMYVILNKLATRRDRCHAAEI